MCICICICVHPAQVARPRRAMGCQYSTARTMYQTLETSPVLLNYHTSDPKHLPCIIPWRQLPRAD